MDELRNEVIRQLSTRVGTTVEKEPHPFDLKFKVWGPNNFECNVMCILQGGEPQVWYLKNLSSKRPNLKRFNHFTPLLKFILSYNNILYEKEESEWAKIEFDNPVDQLFEGD